LIYPPICPALYLFFFLLRRPPISPLFPYTTLFRSQRCRVQPRARQRLRQVQSVCRAEEQRHTPVAAVGDDQVADVVVANSGDGRDRKSTRLNSSHSQISYAVFCLKKKKKKK